MRGLLTLCVLLGLPSVVLAQQSTPPATPAAPVSKKRTDQNFKMPPAPPAPPPAFEMPARYQWDVPGAIERIDVPGEQIAMGIPMKLQAVRSSKSLPDLFVHFERSFLAAKLYVPPAKDIKLPLNEPHITALDPFRKLSYTVIFQKNPDGSVTCIMGEADVGRRQAKGSHFAPTPAGAVGPFETTLDGMRTLTYSIPRPVSEVETFYRDTLAKQGFTEIEPLKFRKGPALWVVRARREGSSTEVMVVDSAFQPTKELQ